MFYKIIIKMLLKCNVKSIFFLLNSKYEQLRLKGMYHQETLDRFSRYIRDIVTQLSLVFFFLINLLNSSDLILNKVVYTLILSMLGISFVVKC